MRIQWGEQFATGHSLVDHQHEALFDAINAFDEALVEGLAPQRMDEMLAFLERYAREHFVTEEFLMVRSEFPGRPLHRTEHERLLLRVKFIRELRDQDPSLVPPEGLGKFLGDWLTNHILTWDLALFKYLKEHPVDV